MESSRETQAERSSPAAERGRVQIPPTTERTPLPVAAPPDETQSIFKAPQPGTARKQLTEGYDPHDFSLPGGDNRAYFAKDKGLADEFAQHYGEGVIEIEVPTSVYEGRLKKHEQLYQRSGAVDRIACSA